jgi:spore coat polysaccharide biosynthesis protein SpsF (cytidylyltransferase family)/biotin carboxylase/RimJ/RimL family protein N-acetyltransferase
MISNSMDHFTVLVTAASGPNVPQAIRYFKASNRHALRVIAVDMKPKGAAGHFADAFLQVPAGTDSGYVQAISAIADSYDVDLILPWSDEEALALANARQPIEERGIILACAPAELLRDMSDKAKACAWLSSLSLPVGQWTRADSREAIAEVVRAIAGRTGEAAIKPANSRGGRNIFVIRKDVRGAKSVNYGRETHLDLATFLDEFLDAAAALVPVVVMERLFEPIFDIDVLAWQGEAKRIVPRRRHNPGGVPFEGNDVLPDAKLIELGRRTAKAIGLNWLYDFDVMTDAQGNPVLIELNPRPSGSMPASIAAGVPLLDDLISLAKGEPLPDVTVPVAQTVVPYAAMSAAPLGRNTVGRRIAIIQARMTSTRLPGKVLATLDGQPLLAHMLERVQRARHLDGVWVATTTNAADDPVAKLCQSLDVPVFRGSESDVLGRFAQAAAQAQADVVMRLTADCPMIDPTLINEAIETFESGRYDYFSNAIQRTYPDGLDMELFTRAALDEADQKATESFQREHVTPYMRVGAYTDVQTGNFRVGQMLAPADFGHLRWTVDTRDDLARVRRLVEQLPKDYTWLDAVALLSRRQDFMVGSAAAPAVVRLRPAMANDVDLLFDWVNRSDKRATALRTTGPVDRTTHDIWFAERLSSPDTGIWMAVDERGAPIGQVRLERRDGALEVDIYVDPAARGRSVGLSMLDEVRALAAVRWPGDPLLARIKPDNWASRRLFVKAGYGNIVMARSHMVLRREPARPGEAA